MKPWLMAALVVWAACETNSAPGAQPTDVGPNTGLQFRDTVPGDAGGEVPDPGQPPADTGQPEDTATPDPDPGPGGEDVILPPDNGPPVGCGGDGTSCNDGDPCTVNDQCVGGTCQGSPVTCDDGIPCTDNQCNQGVCEYPVSAGSCLIGGICYSDGAPNPQNACQRCAAGTAKQSWSTAVGPCDDGNPCTMNDACAATGCVGGPLLDADGDGAAALSCGGTDCNDNNGQVAPGKPEICDDNVDNDCDGKLDYDDDGCTLPNGPCTYHFDCDKAEVCARWGTTGEYRCSATCGGKSECNPGETCSRLPGGAMVGYCQPQLGPNPAGTACQAANECQSGVCLGACADECLNEKNCAAPGHTCAWIPTQASDTAPLIFKSICYPDQPGLKLNGQPCTMWSEQHQQEVYTGDACMSGLCDLSGPTAAYWNCTQLCTSEKNCAPNQVCDFMVYSPDPNPDAAYLSEDTAGIGLRDAQTGCFTTLQQGSLPDGSICNQPSDCQNGRCLALLASSPSTKYCTSYCITDADCGGSATQCGSIPFGLTSAYLADPEVGAQPPMPNSFSMVKVCLP